MCIIICVALCQYCHQFYKIESMHTTTDMRYMCVWQHYRSFYVNTGNLYKGHNIFCLFTGHCRWIAYQLPSCAWNLISVRTVLLLWLTNFRLKFTYILPQVLQPHSCQWRMGQVYSAHQRVHGRQWSFSQLPVAVPPRQKGVLCQLHSACHTFCWGWAASMWCCRVNVYEAVWWHSLV